MAKKEKKNALSMVPIRHKDITWKTNNNIITLIIHRNKMHDKILQRVFKTPEIVKVDLDEIGSFVWEHCDGKSSILDISKKVELHFGEKATPVINRLFHYIKILLNSKFITLQ